MICSKAVQKEDKQKIHEKSENREKEKTDDEILMNE